MTVGERIADLRKHRGLSQYQLAKLLNIATSTLGMYETGKRKPNVEMLEQIAEFFNVSTDYLLGRDPKEDNLKTADKNVQLIAAHIDDGTTPEEMNDILTYIDFIKSKREKK